MCKLWTPPRYTQNLDPHCLVHALWPWNLRQVHVPSSYSESMLRAFILPLLLVPHANGLRVCTTLDKGFDMLLEGSSTTQISDDQLFGFNVDLRKAVLTDMLNISYDLVVMPSYGEVMVETRAGRCDVGWAAFFIYGSRDRCVENSDTCKPMESLDAARAAAPDGFSWTPWRCCVDFSPPFLTYGVAIVYDAKVSAPTGLTQRTHALPLCIVHLPIRSQSLCHESICIPCAAAGGPLLQCRLHVAHLDFLCQLPQRNSPSRASPTHA